MRAYSRASGFKATCELLRTSEGSPQLQSRVLSTLGEVLSGTALEEQSAQGGHAKGGYAVAMIATLYVLSHVRSTEVT